MHMPLRVHFPRFFGLRVNFLDLASLLEIADHMPQGLLNLPQNVMQHASTYS